MLLQIERGRMQQNGKLFRRIRQEVESRGLKQYEFAKMAGLASTTINRILTGDLAISKEAAEAIAIALNWDIEELVKQAFIENEIAGLYERFGEYQSIVKMLEQIVPQN